MTALRFAFLLCVLAAAPLAPARAAAVAETDYATTRVMAEETGFAPGRRLWFAIRQELRPGWHVFWTNPGDAGLPLKLDWSLPDGFAPGDILHPVPDYIPVGPLASFAHEGAPVFLVAVDAPETVTPGETIDVAFHAMWQTCSDICVPEEADFSFAVEVVAAPEKIAAHADVFAEARRLLPTAYDGAATLTANGDAYRLTLSGADGVDPETAFFFAGPEGLIKPSAPQQVVASDGGLAFDLTPDWFDGYDRSDVSGVVAWTAADGVRKGISVVADVPAPLMKPLPPASPRSTSATAGLPWLLLLAFFGGAVLNVMPCVFPIIFIKAASFMASAREHPGVVRAHGGLYAAGAMAMFLLLGGVLLALRAGGAEIGWGFQLQSPAVIAFSAYVLFMVGLNLAGVYTVGESLAGAGQGLAGKQGALGAFFTGALAVFVAAPCIGPLLSAPMGAALLLPPLAGLGVFAVLGAGFAAPYLLLSLFPGLGAKLPKPGAWMGVMRQLLAFPVFAAAAYFLWVLSRQATPGGFGAVLAGLVFLSFGAWCFEQSKGETLRALILRGVASLAAVAAIAPLFRIEAAPAQPSQAILSHGAFRAEPFSPASLNAYRQKGVPVFLEFTAAWCVTCQFDRVTVFSDKRLAAEFDREGVVFMIADWTTPDPDVTEALQSFGASGVPLYVFFPSDGTPVVAPQPITREAVRKMLSGEMSGTN